MPRLSVGFSSFLGQTFGLLNNLLNWSNHVERNLWQMIVSSGQDLSESLDGLNQWHQFSGVASENLSDLQGEFD